MRYFKFLPWAVLSALFFACSFAVPGSVTVKAEPAIRIPLGSRADILTGTEGWNLYDQLEALTDPDSEDYIEGLSRIAVADGDPIAMMLTFGLVDIAIDDFLTETVDLSAIEPAIDPISFSIPVIDFPSESIVLDPIPTDQLDFDPISVNNIPEVSGVAVQTIPVSIMGCSSVTFSGGTMDFSIELTNETVGMEVRINSAVIDYGGASDLVSTTAMPLTLDGTVSFDLSGVTMAPVFDVDLEIEVINGGGPGESFDLTLQPGFSESARIASASDITIDTTVTGTIDVSYTGPDELVSAEIGDGNITVNFDFPAAWDISHYELTLILEQSDGLGSWTGLRSITQSDTTPFIFDLAGLEIGTNNLRIAYSATILSTEDGASFSTPENIGSVAGILNSFSTVEVYSEDIDFSETISQAIDPDVNDLVAAIEFASPQLEISLDNQLPLDLQVTVSSSALRVNDANLFARESNSTWTIPLLQAGGGDPANVLSIPEAMTDVDFTIAVTSSAYDNLTHILTISGVEPGSIYTMSGTAAVDLSLVSVTIDTINESYRFPDESAGEAGLDLSELGGLLLDGVNFSGITATLRTDVGSLLTGGGTLGLRLSTDDYNGSDYYLLGGPASFEPIDGTELVIDGISEIVNSQPSELYFDFAIEANGAVIPAGASDQHLSVVLEVTLPLQFEVTDPNGWELLDADGNPVISASEDDIFGRDPGEDNDQMNELLEMAESVSFHIDITNTTGMTMGVEMNDPESLFSPKIFTLDNGEHTIDFDRTDIEIMANTIPFTPEFRVYIPPGTQTLNQGSESAPADISVSLWMEIETDVEYTAGGEDE